VSNKLNSFTHNMQRQYHALNWGNWYTHKQETKNRWTTKNNKTSKI